MNSGWIFRVGEKVVCVYANTYLIAIERLREEYGRVKFELLTTATLSFRSAGIAFPEATNVEITDYIY